MSTRAVDTSSQCFGKGSKLLSKAIQLNKKFYHTRFYTETKLTRNVQLCF